MIWDIHVFKEMLAPDKIPYQRGYNFTSDANSSYMYTINIFHMLILICCPE